MDVCIELFDLLSTKRVLLREIRDIETIGLLFSRPQIDGRKQRRVDDYFRPKTAYGCLFRLAQ